MTNGDSCALLIRVAQELGLNPEGVIYADLFEKEELHPSSILLFFQCAEAAKKIS